MAILFDGEAPSVPSVVSQISPMTKRDVVYGSYSDYDISLIVEELFTVLQQFSTEKQEQLLSPYFRLGPDFAEELPIPDTPIPEFKELPPSPPPAPAPIVVSQVSQSPAGTSEEIPIEQLTNPQFWDSMDPDTSAQVAVEQFNILEEKFETMEETEQQMSATIKIQSLPYEDKIDVIHSDLTIKVPIPTKKLGKLQIYRQDGFSQYSQRSRKRGQLT